MTATIDKIARAARINGLRRKGWSVLPGNYRGGCDDRLGRWYPSEPGECHSPLGGGYRTRASAWDAILGIAA